MRLCTDPQLGLVQVLRLGLRLPCNRSKMSPRPLPALIPHTVKSRFRKEQGQLYTEDRSVDNRDVREEEKEETRGSKHFVMV